jgi:BirA family biotin operon repressor/biotin-[acetyl-CoA-carboxylase] ligase
MPISLHARMTRTAISPRFAMRTFESTPYRGRVDVTGARSTLAGTRFAAIRSVEQTGSTNTDLVDAARRGEAEQVLVADHQTAGRGRLDRRWEAAPGASLLMSVLVRPPFPARGIHAVPEALGVALVDALRGSTRAAVGLKWPNDIVVAGSAESSGADRHAPDRKLGGMLSESVVTAGGVEAVVVGVGVNVAWSAVPDELEGIATALNLEGATVDRFELVADALARFATALDDPELAARHRAACVTIGRRVRVQRSGSPDLVGTATDVDDGGQLLVRDDDGVVHEVGVGDVVHLRDAT